MASNFILEENCSICLMKIDQKIGIPNHCFHNFCLECLRIWTDENSSRTCPLCRMNYSAVLEINENIEIEHIHINSIQDSTIHPNGDETVFNDSNQFEIDESERSSTSEEIFDENFADFSQENSDELILDSVSGIFTTVADDVN